MTSRLSPILGLVSLTIAAIMACAPCAHASEPMAFVDCDGDGFDDNAPDDDSDGIPDEFERHGYISASGGQLQVSQMFAGHEAHVHAPIHVRCGEGFSRRRFATRAVCENRLDFDTGFGSGLGLGGGLGAGGGCAGGVCF
ncbi:MAG: hypothetical protein AB1772_03600 [Candidatus Zixiibacteriota bacterium]